MTDIYDELLGAEPADVAQPAQAKPNVYDTLLNEAHAAQKQQTQVALDQALSVVPERAATTQSLAKATGLPEDVVERNFDAVSKQVKVREMQSLLNSSPILARQMVDPSFAKIAQADVAQLSGIEKMFAAAKSTGNAGLAGLYGMSAGVVGLAQMPFDVTAPLFDPLTGTILPENPLRRVGEGLSRYRKGIDAQAKGAMPKADGLLGSGYYSGIASLSRNLAALPLAFLNPALAMGVMVAPVAGEEFGKARDAGKDAGTALTFGASQAVIEYATEKLPLSKLLGDLKQGTPFLKTVARQMALEIPGEQIATILQDMNDWAVINPDKPASEYLAERPSAAAQTLIATVVGTGGQVTVMKGIDAIVNRNERRVQNAEVGAQLLEQLNKTVTASQLLQLNPESFEQFVEAAAEDGPIQGVYIDAQTLMQSGVGEQLAAVSPSVAEQIEVAAATGGTVQIPIAEYAARIAPTEFAQGLLEHLKTSPDGFSRAEAREYMQSQAEELQAEVEQRIAEHEGNDEFRASQQRVKDLVLGELNALGRFTESKNELDATLIAARSAVRAAQLGMTPEQFFERQRLRFAAQRIDGEGFAQGAPTDLATQLREEFPGLKLDLSGSTGTVTLSRIEVPQDGREQGAGTQIMERITQWADANGRTVALSPSPDFGGNKRRLVQFYKRFGFVENKGRNKDLEISESMYRPAQQFNQSAVDTPEFRKWFGNSKVVDTNGEPLVVYHGTNKDFDVFSTLAGPRSQMVGDWDGVHFTNDREQAQSIANSLARREGGTPRVVEAYLRAENPASFGQYRTQAQAIEAGHDSRLTENNTGLQEWTVFKPEQIKSATGNRGTFDPNDPNILNQNQRAPRGAFNPDTNTIALLKNADLSTFLHEAGHYFFESDIALAGEIAQANRAFGAETTTEGEQQILNDVSALLRWHGITGDINEQLLTWANLSFEEKRTYHERTAESFEAYLFEGKAPSIELQRYFQNFRAWLLNVYKSLKDFLSRHPEAGQLNDEVRAIFDRMLASNEEIQLAEQGRSMMPLFRTATEAENIGMTPEEFAAYQAQDPQATNDAIQDLQARGLRDLQWTRNARNKEIKKLQRQADELRKQARIEARREVMSQPVYRAWQFLTRKLEADDKITQGGRPKSDPNAVDPSVDSLLVAIAKLGGIRKDDAVRAWGIDPKERPDSGLFGKPVLRATDGHTLDAMREMLAGFGYLDANHTDPDWNPREFEDKFDAELRGDTQYSNQVSADTLLPEDERAGEGLNLEALGGGRLDLASLRDMGFTDDQINVLKARKMTAKTGLHPDLVSDLPGIQMGSGDELVRTILAADPPNEAIEALTDARMLEQHGELATPEAIEREADKAIHNEARARMIATEANALAKATGQRKILVAAAKQFAQSMVARIKVRDVRPTQYANAATRAGKAAQKASQAGDLAKAAAEKRTQLVNTYATRAAYEAREEVDRSLRYLTKFDSDGARKGLDPEYLEQIDTLLERFDLRKGQSLRSIDKRTALAQWIANQELAGLEPDIPEYLLHEANRTSYKNLSVEEFRGLVESVRQIEHLGRLKKKLLTAKDQRDMDAIVDEIRTRIEETSEGRVVDNERRNTAGSKLTQFGRWAEAVHRKASSVVREMDGHTDGGPLWEYFIRSMNEAGDREATMRAEATQHLHKLAKPILAGEDLGGKGKFFPSLARNLNRGERLAIALNWGNESNRQRMTDGRGWTAAQLQPVLDSLTAADWTFVQGVWDFFESYRPEIGAKQKRIYGKEPDWIDPSPFTIRTADGKDVQVRGGYYPVKYDPNQSGKAGEFAEAEEAKALMRAAHTAATTRRSFTKTRAEEVVGRPVLLTFDGIWQGANEVIHDLTWHEWLIDATRLLKRLDGPIRTHYGAEYVDVLRKAVKDTARGDIPAAHALERSLNHVRTGATVVGLGWNLTTALLQPLGITHSIVRLGAKWAGRGIVQFYGSPVHMLEKAREVQAMSPFMANRALTLNREINDVRNRLEARSNWQQRREATYFWLIQKVQAAVDYPTWLGAYEKAMADPANTEERAIALADQAVVDTQGGGQIKDLSQSQRGSPGWKLFTNFYSYFNVLMNLTAEQTRSRVKAKEYVGLMGDYLLLMVIPAVLGSLLRSVLKGEDDPDEYIKSMLAELVAYPFGMFVGLRETAGAVQSIAGVGGPFNYGGPAGARVFTEIDKLGKQIGQGDLDMALFKAANSTAGILFHYPAGQVNRLVDGAAALIDGKTKNPLAPLTGYAR